MSIKPLTIYSLSSPSGSYHGNGSHPELHHGRGWLTLDEAKAAALRVLARLADKHAAEVVAWSSALPPDAAQLAYSDPTRHACETEVRIVSSNVEWRSDTKGRDTPTAMLEIRCEYRHRWREARMVVKALADGTAEQTYDLKPPGEWSKWSPSRYRGPGPDQCPGNDHHAIEIRAFTYQVGDDEKPKARKR